MDCLIEGEKKSTSKVGGGESEGEGLRANLRSISAPPSLTLPTLPPSYTQISQPPFPPPLY